MKQWLSTDDSWGASYLFHLVGNKRTIGPEFYQLLTLVAPVFRELFAGRSVQLDEHSNVSKPYGDFTAILAEHPPLPHPNRVRLKASDRAVCFDVHSDWWHLWITLPVTDQDLTDANVEQCLLALWKETLALQPIFSVSGEELVFSDDEVRHIRAGTLDPRDIPMCNLAIISTDLLPDDEEPCNTDTGPGVFFRNNDLFRTCYHRT